MVTEVGLQIDGMGVENALKDVDAYPTVDDMLRDAFDIVLDERRSAMALTFGTSRNDEEGQFKIAMAGVMLKLGKEHEWYEDISEALKMMKTISAFLGALQAGLNVDAPSLPEARSSLPPLMQIWREEKGRKR